MDSVIYFGQAIFSIQPRQPDLTRSIGMLITTPRAHAPQGGRRMIRTDPHLTVHMNADLLQPFRGINRFMNS
jgi:hypothetical protein